MNPQQENNPINTNNPSAASNDVNQSSQLTPQPKDNHGITIAAMALFVLLALGAVAFLYYQNQQLKNLLANYQTPPSPTPTILETASPSATTKSTPTAKPAACTQEAKLCPNGSYVGRTGPNCEFAPCPTP